MTESLDLLSRAWESIDHVLAMGAIICLILYGIYEAYIKESGSD